MNAGIDDQTHGAEQFARETPVIADRVLIETDFLAELLGVQRPALDVSRVAGVLPKLGQVRELLRDRELHVMSGYAFVIRDGFVVDETALRELGGRHDDPARTLAVRRARL